MHVPDQKLEDKSKVMVFIGYHPTGAYKLFDPSEEKVALSCDVVILEYQCWDWNHKCTKTMKTKIVENVDNSIPMESTTMSEDERHVQSDESGRPRRQWVQPQRFGECEIYSDAQIDDEGDLVHMALLAEAEPIDEIKALKEPVWRNAMREEIKSIEKNGIWQLVDLPPKKKSISVKWVFKRKLRPDGSVSRYKARLVVKGFLQKQGLDFNGVFAPVARMDNIRLVIVVACARRWSLCKLDVKSAFLHGPLEEEVYIQQPPEFVNKDKEHCVYRLRKALYGLKQAPRAWNKHIDAFLMKIGFTKCVVEH
ncbi:hypothetical protein V8G54_037125 [Vigna mungo]|uniref:Reverse transcriptase Ty1/copia-type domain-containing protein n=1 Tax=Vigna mungo TaxID=3915 RepID=A0AAQ3MIK0_VIGMU